MSLSLKAARGSLRSVPSPMGRAVVPRVTQFPLALTAPSATQLRKSGATAVNASWTSVIGAGLTGFAQGGIGGALSGIGGALSGGGTPLPTTTPTLPGGAAAGTGHGISSTGTGGGGCVTVLGQQFCLGGSVGGGSGFTAGGGTGVAVGGMGGGGAAGSCATRGHHYNKRGYWTKQGYVAPGSKLVKNRRRNPLNPRALSHSLVRLTGFQRAATKIEKHLGQVARKAVHGRRSPRALPAPRGGRSCGCK